MAKRGANVILACRDLKKAESALNRVKVASNNGSVCVEELDLACLSSVKSFADRVLANQKSVDILINNAGVMSCPQWLTVDKLDYQFQVNFLSH